MGQHSRNLHPHRIPVSFCLWASASMVIAGCGASTTVESLKASASDQPSAREVGHGEMNTLTWTRANRLLFGDSVLDADSAVATPGLGLDASRRLVESGGPDTPSPKADRWGIREDGLRIDDLQLELLKWDPAKAGLPVPVQITPERFLTEPGSYVLIDGIRGICVVEHAGKLTISVRSRRKNGGSSSTTPRIDPDSNWFAYVESHERVWVYCDGGNLTLMRYGPEGRITNTCSCHRWHELNEQMPRAVRERLPKEFLSAPVRESLKAHLRSQEK
jgi:hypothetical protein